MFIFRFEGNDGNGIYNPSLFKGLYLNKFNKLVERHKKFNITKPRGRTVNGFIPRKHYFGFNSIYQLKKWFSRDELSFLKESGMVLKLYKVDRSVTITDGYQTVFEKEFSHFIKYIDISKIGR